MDAELIFVYLRMRIFILFLVPMSLHPITAL